MDSKVGNSRISHSIRAVPWGASTPKPIGAVTVEIIVSMAMTRPCIRAGTLVWMIVMTIPLPRMMLAEIMKVPAQIRTRLGRHAATSAQQPMTTVNQRMVSIRLTRGPPQMLMTRPPRTPPAPATPAAIPTSCRVAKLSTIGFTSERIGVRKRLIMAK